MKFLCVMEFMHSGGRFYRPGGVYAMERAEAEALAALDSRLPGGALAFFKAADAEAAELVKALAGGTPPEEGPLTAGAALEEGAKAAKAAKAERAALVAEAEALGIAGASKTGTAKLREAVAAKKAEEQPPPEAA
jgi:hypothetical protein